MILLIPFMLAAFLVRVVWTMLPTADFLPYPDKVAEFWTVIGVALGQLANAFGLTGSGAILHTVVLATIGFVVAFFFIRAATHWRVAIFVMVAAKVLENIIS